MRTFINLVAHVFYTYRKSRASVLARFNFREVLSNQFEYHFANVPREPSLFKM